MDLVLEEDQITFEEPTELELPPSVLSCSNNKDADKKGGFTPSSLSSFIEDIIWSCVFCNVSAASITVASE